MHVCFSVKDLQNYVWTQGNYNSFWAIIVLLYSNIYLQLKIKKCSITVGSARKKGYISSIEMDTIYIKIDIQIFTKWVVLVPNRIQWKHKKVRYVRWLVTKKYRAKNVPQLSLQVSQSVRDTKHIVNRKKETQSTSEPGWEKISKLLVDTWIGQIKRFSKFVAMQSDGTPDSPVEFGLDQSSQDESPWSHHKCEVERQCNTVHVLFITVPKNRHPTIEWNLVPRHHHRYPPLTLPWLVELLYLYFATVEKMKSKLGAWMNKFLVELRVLGKFLVNLRRNLRICGSNSSLQNWLIRWGVSLYYILLYNFISSQCGT